jgi:hypothetical protein
MKKYLIPLFILAIVILSGCCNCEDQPSENIESGVNALLPTEVVVKHNVHIDRQTGGQDWSGGLNLKDFIHEIFNKVLNGKISSFDPDYIPGEYKELSTESLKRKAGEFVDTVQIQDMETGEIRYELIEGKMNPEEIKILHFTEKWHFDKETFKLSKEVIELDVVREFMRSDSAGMEMMKVCAFHFDNPDCKINSKDVENKELLAENIKYEFNLHQFDSWIEDLDQETFLELIMQKVREDAVDIFDFNDHSIKYTYQDILNQNDFLIDTVVVMVDPENMKKELQIIQHEFDTDMIGSYIFTENWYYDPDSYKIIKEVKGVAPVLHYYNEADYEMTDLQKKILFQINFN